MCEGSFSGSDPSRSALPDGWSLLHPCPSIHARSCETELMPADSPRTWGHRLELSRVELGTSRARSGGPGRFVTFVEVAQPDGRWARWESRRQRKHAGTADSTSATWWAPRARGWWIGV